MNIEQLFDELFLKLQAIFPAWKTSYTNQQSIDLVKREWVAGFVENGVNTTEQIKLGLSVARQHNSPFMPSCGQFISWCRPTPKQLGLLDTRRAYNSMFNNMNEPDDITKAARKEVGSYNLSNWSESKSYPIFEKVYNRLVSELVNNPESLQLARDKKLLLTH